MCIVGDGNNILGRVVCDGMNTGNFLLTDIVDTQHLGLRLVQAPALLAIQILYNLLSQRDGGAGRSIQFVYMMGLHHIHIILFELVHYLCQIFVYGTEDGHTYTEVAGPEERLTFCGTSLTYFGLVVLHPTG